MKIGSRVKLNKLANTLNIPALQRSEEKELGTVVDPNDYIPDFELGSEFLGSEIVLVLWDTADVPECLAKLFLEEIT